MQKYHQQKQQPQQRKAPVINLSSDEESDQESDKENDCGQSVSAHTAYSHTQKPAYRSTALSQLKSNFPAESQCKMNQLQFSTLSLDEPSILQYEQQIRNLTNEKSALTQENAELRRVNKELQQQIQIINERYHSEQSRDEELKEELEKAYLKMDEMKAREKKLMTSYRKLEKESENKLINQELPRRASPEQLNRIYTDVTDKIKSIADRYLQDFSKARMNIKVENLLSDFINELLQINPAVLPKSANSSQFSSIKSISSLPTNKRPSRLAEEAAQVSQEYRLLEKSIDKLKNMEKDIDSCSGSYLKRMANEDNPANRSVVDNSSLGLDNSSILGVDRSKSRRKRIFQ